MGFDAQCVGFRSPSDDQGVECFKVIHASQRVEMPAWMVGGEVFLLDGEVDCALVGYQTGAVSPCQCDGLNQYAIVFRVR